MKTSIRSFVKSETPIVIVEPDVIVLVPLAWYRSSSVSEAASVTAAVSTLDGSEPRVSASAPSAASERLKFAETEPVVSAKPIVFRP